MRLNLIALSLSLGLLAPAAAYASPLNPDVTFYLNGATFQQGPTATGTVTINTVTGTFVSEDVTFTWNRPGVGPTTYLFNGPVLTNEQGCFAFDCIAIVYDQGGDLYDLELPGNSLVGYTGGNVCTVSNSYTQCGGGIGQLGPVGYAGAGDIYQASGYLSPTPEPSSLVLLGTGMVGVAAAVRRRFRKN